MKAAVKTAKSGAESGVHGSRLCRLWGGADRLTLLEMATAAVKALP